MDSWYSRRLGMTTPTPLPDRVGAARMTNCWPERRIRSLPNLPTTIPLGEIFEEAGFGQVQSLGKSGLAVEGALLGADQRN